MPEQRRIFANRQPPIAIRTRSLDYLAGVYHGGDQAVVAHGVTNIVTGSPMVEDTFDRCFQLMDCEDPSLFQQWTVHWEDLVAFEIVHVVSTTEAREAALSGQGLPQVGL